MLNIRSYIDIRAKSNRNIIASFKVVYYIAVLVYIMVPEKNTNNFAFLVLERSLISLCVMFMTLLSGKHHESLKG